ncbi:MAG: SRPBCC family protein [Acidimicrobiales bacterium]
MEKPDEVLAHNEASILVSAPPDVVYDLVSDLPRMGEWSPEALGGEWKDGGSGEAGDWFVGHNRAGEREWTRESEVAVAEPGREFTFVVGGVEANCTWWSYEMSPVDGGTRLTERWWLVNKTPGVQAMSEEQFQARVALTQTSIEQTLAAIKATAESRPR